MCEFCKNIYTKDYTSTKYKDYIYKDEHGVYIHFATGDSFMDFDYEINNCPMCGRKLAEENEKEKIKIISDGETAKLFIDGKKVPGKDVELHFSAHAGEEPMIVIDANWIKTDENNVPMLNGKKTEVLTEGIKINC
jgi:hypothetical protein